MNRSNQIFSFKLRTKVFCKKYAIAFLFTFALLPAFTQADTCDSSLLERADSGKDGYKDRGGICEGLYESPVSADFELVSLVESPLSDYKQGDVISIEAPIIDKEFGKSSISIRGLALRPQLYYRMDTNFKGAKPVEWSVDGVLTSINLKASELGMGLTQITRPFHS